MNILVYGDSNSWGYIDDGTGLRYEGRWTEVMKQHLNCFGKYTISQDCLPGRLVATDDPKNGKHFNGRSTLLSSVLAHSPINHVLLMLGTNSFKYCMCLSAQKICDQILEVANLITTSTAGAGSWHDSASPTVTVICPPILGKKVEDPNWIGYSDWIGGAEKSRALPSLLERAVNLSNFDYFDSNMIVSSSHIDPIHLSAENHHKLGEGLARHIIGLKIQKN